MKKKLFFLAVAAVALASCSNDETVSQNTTNNQPKEIAFMPLTQPTTRAAVDGTAFPTTTTMTVAAYDVANTRNFFAAKQFAKGANATWVSDPATYWPLSPTTINFLAYANLTEGSAEWNATYPANEVALTMDDNKEAQNDLMFAIGTGSVVQNSDNSLAFPTSVPMVFKHAQAWIQFTVKANTAAEAAKITVNSITLNDVSCQGVCTVTQTNYDAISAQSVAAVWSAYGTYAANVAAVVADGYSALSASKQEYANLMVVPNQGITSFTINYTIDEKAYDYTYTITDGTLAQAKKYTYDINFTLHEIEIAPSIEDWVDETPVAVEIPNEHIYAYAVGAVAGTYSVAKTAGTYTCTVTGLTAGATYDITEQDSDADWLYIAATSVVADSNGKANLTFTVTANTDGARNKNIVLTNHADGSNNTMVAVSQATGN